MPLKDPVKLKEYRRLYYLKNKEKLKEEIRLYKQSEEGIKVNRIAQWKYIGILCFDWNLLNDIFLSTNKCEICNVELNTNTKTRKCLDHDHNITDRFNVRYVLCNSCNIKLG